MVNKCKRCPGLVLQRYSSEYPFCAMCGWQDYSYIEPKPKRVSTALSGNVVRLRYVGTSLTDEIKLKNRNGSFTGELGKVQDHVVTVLLKSVPNTNKMGSRLVIQPICPFCDVSTKMSKSTPVRIHKYHTEERYSCRVGHRIGVLFSLKDKEKGELTGWR